MGVAQHDRYTWTGYIFGRKKKRILDYIFIDARSRGRTVRGRGVPKAHIQARTSHTEQRLRQELKQAPTDADRRSARTRLQRVADTIRREKDVSQGTYVMHHLRDGGWGAKDVAPPMATMPYHQATDAQQRAYDPRRLQAGPRRTTASSWRSQEMTTHRPRR